MSMSVCLAFPFGFLLVPFWFLTNPYIIHLNIATCKRRFPFLHSGGSKKPHASQFFCCERYPSFEKATCFSNFVARCIHLFRSPATNFCFFPPKGGCPVPSPGPSGRPAAPSGRAWPRLCSQSSTEPKPPQPSSPTRTRSSRPKTPRGSPGAHPNPGSGAQK